ncbi:hypothetical protein B0H13DRAFT_2650441 [Mycena leptocephala]|nr:hypothetical protein B0H13DRAFT_2650441 [Mycena leptocephala]
MRSSILLHASPSKSLPRFSPIPACRPQAPGACASGTHTASQYLSYLELHRTIHAGPVDDNAYHFPVRGRLERSATNLASARGYRALSITLEGEKVDEDVAAIIWQHGLQLKHLRIYNTYDEEPGYKSTFWEIHREYSYAGWCSATQILDLLRRAPSLVECSFECLRFDGLLDVQHVEDTAGGLILPTLRQLTFGIHDPDSILRRLSLPAVEKLSLSLCDVSGGDLLSFLIRSSPPLQELDMGHNSAALDFTQLAECFRLVPTLTCFKAWRPGGEGVDALFAALAESPSVLPNLQTLMIFIDNNSASESSWKTLLRSLSARRTQLQKVHIYVRRNPYLSIPEAEILAAFRELAADGIDVYVANVKHMNSSRLLPAF